MSRIQRFPEALLALLELKTAGISPQQLSQQVVPSIDMLPHYLSPLEQPVFGSTVALAASGNTGISLTVPANQFWLPRFLTLRVAAGVAPFSGLVGWRLVRNNVSAYLPGFVPPAGGSLTLSTAGASIEATWDPPWAFLLRPGDRFEVESSSVTAGTCGATVSGLVAVLNA